VAVEERDAAALRPVEIEGQRFSLGKRGYEPQEVHAYLMAVADQVGRLQGEIDWQRARVEHLEQRNLTAQDSAYERISREFMDVVRRADEAAGQVRARAEDEALATMDAARKDADRMVARAAEEADRILLTARTEAERVVAEATEQVQRLVRRAGAESASGGSYWQERDATSGGTRPGFDPFGAATAQVTAPPPPMVAAPGPFDQESTPGAATVHERLPEPVFTDFERLDLSFDGSLFDLFGEAGA
jgi:DivIVA domain-containing protein